MGQFVRKVVAAQERRSVALCDRQSEWVGAHPALHEYLTLDTFEDGASRETSMLMAFIEDSKWKVCLQDRAEGRSLWTTAQTLAEAMDALEIHLAAGTGDWRQMRGQAGGGGRRKR